MVQRSFARPCPVDISEQWNGDKNRHLTQERLLLRWRIKTLVYSRSCAFWPIYVANPEFDVSFATALTPLVDKGVESNNPPVGIVSLQGHNEVFFLFTLSPGESWSMLEGGFSLVTQPSGIAMYEVTLQNTGPWCVGYDQKRVIQWDIQTQTNLQGFSPNPSTFNTVQVLSESDTPYDVLPFNDWIFEGQCTSSPPNPTCLQQITDGVQSMNVNEVLDGILCVLKLLGLNSSSLLKHEWNKSLRT